MSEFCTNSSGGSKEDVIPPKVADFLGVLGQMQPKKKIYFHRRPPLGIGRKTYSVITQQEIQDQHGGILRQGRHVFISLEEMVQYILGGDNSIDEYSERMVTQVLQKLGFNVKGSEEMYGGEASHIKKLAEKMQKDIENHIPFVQNNTL